MASIPDSFVNTIIGAGTVVDGDIDVDGLVRVDGSIKGTIRTRGKIVVGASGRCESSIKARSAVIGGIVKGDVCVADRVTVLPGGTIVGNIFAPHLDAEQDVVIHGVIEVTGRTENAESDLAAFLQKHGGDDKLMREPINLSRRSFPDKPGRGYKNGSEF